MSDSRAIKELKTRLRTLKDEEIVLEMEAKEANRKWNAKQNEIKEVKKQIRKLETGVSINIELSEHAMCRYFERVKGVSPEKIMEEILTDEVKQMIETLGPNGKYPIAGGHRLVVKNNRIVTIEPAH
jgi:predicted  nucleic acid-binding Zn-ribbon protein